MFNARRSTYKFIREVHGIPKSQKLSWCLIIYSEAERPERLVRLGVALLGTNKAIDLSDGVFINDNSWHKVELATRRTIGDYYIYESENHVQRLPNYFVSDMYYKRVYSKEMMESYLL